MSQISITPTFHIKRPGGMREAVRRPTGDGVLDQIQESPWLWSSILRQFWDPCTPLLFPPGTLHIPPGRPQITSLLAQFRLQKRIQNFIDFSMPCWVPKCSQKPPKIHPKSIPKSIKKLTHVLIDCLMNCGPKTPPKTYQKSIKNQVIFQLIF